MKLKMLLAEVVSSHMLEMSYSSDTAPRDLSASQNDQIQKQQHIQITKLSLADLDISNLCLDTRALKLGQGDGFVAIPGVTTDGRNYIQDSITNGAKVVLAEYPVNFNAITGHIKNDNDNDNDNDNEKVYFAQNIPIIEIKNLKTKLGKILENLYKVNESNLKKIAITGTNGKTSCANYIANIFSGNKVKAATIGTLGYGFLDQLQYIGLTTPDCVTNYKILAELVKSGAGVVTIEASSHALEQHRLANLAFETVVFTNLSQDHLDYHITLENYWKAKKALFLDYKFKNAVINIDDEKGMALYKELSEKIDKNKTPNNIESITHSKIKIKNKNNCKLTNNDKVANHGTVASSEKPANHSNLISYSVKNNKADVTVTDINYSFSGTIAKINTIFGSGYINSKLIGEFNLSNLLASISVALLANIPLQDILRTVSILQPVAGRMMSFGGIKQPLVIVDFAHTPDALLQVLKTLKQLAKANIITVFGCGGDRDKTKRPKMLAIARFFSNKIIITNDNPRGEEPQTIASDILGRTFVDGVSGSEAMNASDAKHFNDTKHANNNIKHANNDIKYDHNDTKNINVNVILDRALAIKTAILNANLDDIVLIAGKGHEDYQIIGDKKLHFSDSEVVSEVLSLNQYK